MNQKQAIINALRAFVNQRPGFEMGNYSTMADYRSDSRKATKDRDVALQLLRDIELRNSITAEAILKEARSGRVSIHSCGHGDNGRTTCGACGAIWCGDCSPAPSAMCHKCNGGERYPNRPGFTRVDYCTGQYFPTEFRAAVARLCASVLWTWKREMCMPVKGSRDYREDSPVYQGKCYVFNNEQWMSAGDWLRASFKREYGSRIANRFFN